MTNKPTKILIVEDDASLADVAEHQLKTAGYQVDVFSSGEKAWESFDDISPDLVLTDLILKGNLNGDHLLKKIKSRSSDLPVILMTANGTIDSAVECVRSGAWNYLTKPFHWDDMLDQIQKALTFRSIKIENIHLKNLTGSYNNFNNIISQSAVMADIKKQCSKFSESNAPVLIQGESGTGKELLARSLHLCGPRKNHPFIAVNCGAIVKELAESELFGHVKGAFTGATHHKKGFFMEADEGTIFLDEISELPLHLQVKLLRVLQESEVTPVGQSKPLPINVRVVAATNVDLSEAVKNGDFREDLYYRVTVLPLSLPPLRKRPEDIESLCNHFLQKSGRVKASFSKELFIKLKSYKWPGNIRELENFITRLLVLNPDIEKYDISHTPENFLQIQSTQPVPYSIPEEGLDLNWHMKKLIESALIKCDGNQTKAAKMLNITRSALIYRMQKLGIHQ